MKNRDVYQRDPFEITLLNHGVATVTDALTGDERRTLRFELTHFVCEGQYRSGLVRILESYLSHQGQPEQPAAWISGFFGSGKSHLAKMLRFLWTDYAFPEDGARARGLARLPDDVRDLLTEVSTLGRRGHGLHAAAGTLGAGAGDSVRLALLGVVFKSAGLPESFPQARFCLWLRKNGIYEQVRDAVATARRGSRRGTEPAPETGLERDAVEAAEREFRRELNDLYVSPLIARALLAADPHFAGSEKDARAALRAQFPRPADITTDECIGALKDTPRPRRRDALHGRHPRRGAAVHRGGHRPLLRGAGGRRGVQQALRRPPALPGHRTDRALRHPGPATPARAFHGQRGALGP